jgi:hypothetical protein
MDSHRR